MLRTLKSGLLFSRMGLGGAGLGGSSRKPGLVKDYKVEILAMADLMIPMVRMTART